MPIGHRLDYQIMPHRTMVFSKHFFSQPATASVPAGVYLAVTRRPLMADPFTLSTAFFCRGHNVCRYTWSFSEVMHTKVAIDPEESEERRASSRLRVKWLKGVAGNGNFVGPEEYGCAPVDIRMNVIHFPVVRANDGPTIEHALLVGPCEMDEYSTTARALELLGVDETFIVMIVVEK